MLILKSKIKESGLMLMEIFLVILILVEILIFAEYVRPLVEK